MPDIKKPSNTGILACYLKGGGEIIGWNRCNRDGAKPITVKEMKGFLDSTPISERENMAKQIIDDGSVVIVNGKPKFAHD